MERKLGINPEKVRILWIDLRRVGVIEKLVIWKCHVLFVIRSGGRMTFTIIISQACFLPNSLQQHNINSINLTLTWKWTAEIHAWCTWHTHTHTLISVGLSCKGILGINLIFIEVTLSFFSIGVPWKNLSLLFLDQKKSNHQHPYQSLGLR